MAAREHKAFPIVVRDLEVLDAFDVTPRTRRVVLTGAQLGAFENGGHRIAPFRTENADDHVKLIVPGAGVVPPVQEDGHLDWPPGTIERARDYTPRRYDPDARRLELDFVRHAGGPAAEWAGRARPGDRVLVAGPRGTTVLPAGIDWYFLAGDETALPAIARRIEELPAGTPVTAVVSVASAGEEQTFDHRADLDLTWVHRDTAGPGALMDAVRAAPWRTGQVYAWAAGEAGMLRPIRRWLEQDRRVPAGRTDIAGYWRAGRAQHETSQEMDRLRHAASLAVPYAIRAAVTLDLAEHVTDGRTTVPDLAAAAGARPRGIRKILAVLAHQGYFTLGADDVVALTPAGTFLLEEQVHGRLDHRNGYARLDDSWPGLLHAARTGESGFEHAAGHSFWAELAGDERLGRTFDGDLARWSGTWSPDLVKALALTGEHLVDVGGGTGTFLAHVLAEAPGVRATLVELPTTAERARAHLAERGLADRVAIAAQSFFEELPAGRDLYLLAQVLHDWPDEEAVAILTRVAEAARGRRVVVLERVATPADEAGTAAFDLQMYTVFGSGERDRDEFAALGERAGLRLESATRIHANLHAIEFRTA
ncbi:SIP domain-containing protein [Actinomadura rugatobispora]|uniref:SIP domain-containing protein n=1 Tax=Actinomadura rugatobispora TaxID=1994 RepID=A0ABW1A7E9_9ACTN|nr:hypothetical protein GCM10010200_092070 [Actinomadura rugatobispora]